MKKCRIFGYWNGVNSNDVLVKRIGQKHFRMGGKKDEITATATKIMYAGRYVLY